MPAGSNARRPGSGYFAVSESSPDGTLMGPLTLMEPVPPGEAEVMNGADRAARRRGGRDLVRRGAGAGGIDGHHRVVIGRAAAGADVGIAGARHVHGVGGFAAAGRAAIDPVGGRSGGRRPVQTDQVGLPRRRTGSGLLVPEALTAATV